MSEAAVLDFGRESALAFRNRQWRGHPLIPHWVDVGNVGLDQFYTRPEVAAACHADLASRMADDHAPLDAYTFIEPSAGGGAFYDLLPKARRIGLDVAPSRPEFELADFLSWSPPEGERYAVVGNPPFGYRAWLALAFVNHAARFADYVGMILPMAFQSDGKGSPKHRVRGLRLLHSAVLAPDCFTDADGKALKINALWQVWQRGVNNHRAAQTCSNWIDLFTVDQRKERLCGHGRIHEADWFLQRTFYGDAIPKLVRKFSEVRYVCGYGIVIRRARRDIEAVLNATDWRRYSNLAAHNCRHISMGHIRRALTDAGFVDAGTQRKSGSTPPSRRSSASRTPRSAMSGRISSSGSAAASASSASSRRAAASAAATRLGISA